MKYTVQLTREEMQECLQAAKIREENSERTGRRGDLAMGDSFEQKLIGMYGEKALSILVGIEVNLGDYENKDSGDVGELEARSTEFPTPRLIVNARDVRKKKLGRAYILAVHRKNGLIEFLGWHFGWFLEKFGTKEDFTSKNGRITQKDCLCLHVSKLRAMDEVICLARGIPVNKSIRGWEALSALRD